MSPELAAILGFLGGVVVCALLDATRRNRPPQRFAPPRGKSVLPDLPQGGSGTGTLRSCAYTTGARITIVHPPWEYPSGTAQEAGR